MKDSGFQADVKSRKLLNMRSTGEEVESVVKKMLATPKPLIEKTRKVLGYAS